MAVAICLSMLFAVPAAFAFFFYFQQRRKAEASAAWPATQGKIVRSWVRTESSWDTDTGTTYSYFPEVRYEYEVMGQKYEGKNISFGGSVGSSSRAYAEKVIAQYPADKEVTVYYNPEKPSEAVLERGMRGGTLLLILGGVLGLLAACTFLVGLITAISH